MAETKTCQNCKNWFPCEKWCWSLEYIDAYHGTMYLETEPDFGCTKFEPKGDLK